MRIYENKTVGDAWQYNGDLESMPEWVKSFPSLHVEINECNHCQVIIGATYVFNGDWFVKLDSDYGNHIHIYSDETFSLLYKMESTTEGMPHKKYYTKPQPVDAWQYNGSIELTKLPGWVVDLILHRNFGYCEVENRSKYDPVMAIQYFDGLNWVVVSEGDWLVRYDECTIGVVSDEKFKELFEEKEAK